MKAFVDTSSLLKLYHNEIDSDKILNGIVNIDEIYLCEIAILEFRSAIWKKVREGNIKQDIAVEVIKCFHDDYANFQWINLDSKIIESASELLMKYGNKGLRTLDSLQLASALILKNKPCVFLTSDKLVKSLFIEESLNVL